MIATVIYGDAILFYGVCWLVWSGVKLILIVQS